MQVGKQEKEIITSNMTNLSKFISSTNDDTQNYLFFNETLFLNHNNWLENIKSQIRRSIKGQTDSINFSNIAYNKDIYNLLQKIAKPNNYRTNENINNDNINQEDMDKLDKLTDFNDILGANNNICSKYKRESLLSRIHNNNNENINNNNENVNNINPDDNNRITFNENNNNENNKIIDDDIIMEDIISSTQKVKLSSGQIEKEENSLCTIVEQPSLEEMKKSIFSNKFNTNQYEEKNKTGINTNYILDFNSNSCNVSNNLININKSANNNFNYKKLKLSESIITPKKEENISINNNINISNNTPNNKNKEIIVNQQFSFNKLGQNNNINNSNNNIHINSKNELTFNFSSNKKYLNNLSSNKTPQDKEKLVLNSNIKDNNINNINNNVNNNITDTPTLNPIFPSSNTKNNINNTSNTTNTNNNNFIYTIANTINKINEDNNNNINNINNNIPKKNYVQEIVLLSSTKKVPEINNNVKNKKKKEKYLDDYEEYEMSDSSRRGDEEEEDEEEELNNKFKPKWALDEEYISAQLLKQNNNKELVFKSFGNFVVERLNLNMIFETHNQKFDIRNSTADWRGDDSWTKNKVTDVNDIEGNDIFPNRKLQFV